MDFVENQDRALTLEFPSLRRGFGQFANLGDAARDRTFGLHMGAGVLGNEEREGCFAASGRRPKDRRPEGAVKNLLAKRKALRQKVPLAHVLIQGGGPHPGGEWRPVRCIFGIKEINSHRRIEYDLEDP